MLAISPYTLPVDPGYDEKLLLKGSWLVILHALRIPPHVGLMIDGEYHSLTIKGHELGIKTDVLLQTIARKKIETVVVRLVKQPVFSADYQREIMALCVKQFPKVEAGKASCLSPVKVFLQEFYAIPYESDALLFEVVERLKQNHYLETAFSFNMDGKLPGGEYTIPVYSHERLQEVIAFETAQHP